MSSLSTTPSVVVGFLQFIHLSLKKLPSLLASHHSWIYISVILLLPLFADTVAESKIIVFEIFLHMILYKNQY